MKKKLALIVALVFYASLLPWRAPDAAPCVQYYDQCASNVTGDNTGTISGFYQKINGSSNYYDNLFDGSYSLTPKVADLIVKSSPWVDVRAESSAQVAIDNNYDSSSLSGFTIVGTTILVPPGTTQITSALIVKPGVRLVGMGKVKSQIERTTAGPVIVLGHNAAGYSNSMTEIRNLSLKGTSAGTSHGIQFTGATDEARNIGYLNISDVFYTGGGYGYYQNPQEGIGAGLYGAQNVHINRLVVRGGKGVVYSSATNILNIENCGMEWIISSGSSGVYFISGTNAGQSGFFGNVRLVGNLAEGAGDFRGFVIDNVMYARMEDNWFEVTTSTQYALEIQNSTNVTVSRFFGASATNKIRIGASENVEISGVSVDDIDPATAFSIASSSNVRLKDSRGQYFTYGKAWASEPKIDGWLDRTVSTGWSKRYSLPDVVHKNLFVNGSFDGGVYQWTDLNTNLTLTREASDVLTGYHIKAAVGSGAGSIVSQTVTITAGMVNRPLTISYLARADNSSVIASAYINGCGLSASYSNHRVQMDNTWRPFSATITPTSAGTLTIGPSMYLTPYSAYNFYLDALTLVQGSEPVLMDQTVQQEGIRAAAAPNTGTWDNGAVVWNTGGDNVVLWKVTSGGTPGTWASLSLP